MTQVHSLVCLALVSIHLGCASIGAGAPTAKRSSVRNSITVSLDLRPARPQNERDPVCELPPELDSVIDDPILTALKMLPDRSVIKTPRLPRRVSVVINTGAPASEIQMAVGQFQSPLRLLGPFRADRLGMKTINLDLAALAGSRPGRSAYQITAKSGETIDTKVVFILK